MQINKTIQIENSVYMHAVEHINNNAIITEECIISHVVKHTLLLVELDVQNCIYSPKALPLCCV